MERTFFLTALTLLFVSTGLALALAGVVYKGELFGLGPSKGLDGSTPRSGESTAAFTAPQDQHRGVCMTPGCVTTASEIMENMDTRVDPCQDFFQFACGGFVDRTAIPDDRTRMSSFSVLGDKLLTQVGPSPIPHINEDTFKSQKKGMPYCKLYFSLLLK